MDQIPARFYPLIIKELQDSVRYPATPLPAVLTREFLDPYGCTGSLINPLVCPVLSSDMMISYGSVFFTGGGKTICLPLVNLIGRSQLYLNEDGMFRPIASFVADPVVGMCLDPVYFKQERCHEYWDVTLCFEPRENVDILKFVVSGKHTTLIHIKDGKQHIADPSDPVPDPRLSDFRQQLRRLQEPAAQQLDTELSLLNDRELDYLSTIIHDYTLMCPYSYFQKLSDRCNEANDYIDDLVTKFNMLLTFRSLNDEAQLLEFAKQLDQFTLIQIVKIISVGYWTLFEYILYHPKFSHSLRKEVVYILLKEQPELVTNIPEQLILGLYNWRNTATTNQWVTALNNAGRYQTAALVSIAPFEPSRLRIAQAQF